MLQSWLPPGGENLFQKIKQVCQEAEASGKKLYRLSIGQPQGPALKSAREKCAEYALSEEECWHEYQDNGCVPIQLQNFAKRFAEAHVQTNLLLTPLGDHLDYLPIPGIKPMIGLIPLACGLGRHGRLLEVGSMTNPGYPVPETWSKYLRVNHFSLRTDPGNVFRPDLENEENLASYLDLAMLNLPNNPSGTIATRQYWRETCAFCEKNGIRLFNDGAYLALAHSDNCFALADVAPEFPELSWLEAYSASKSIANGTGWRVGAVVGSPDFVNDLRTIKGNTDSGFFAPAAGGALYALENDQDGIAKVRKMYEVRLRILITWLENQGLELAIKPGAGFFTLWKAPKRAFGRKMKDAEDFNLTMIRETGVVGVHFDPYIRYAVCRPIEKWADPICDAFTKANVSY